MDTASLVVDKARQLAAAGHHAEVVAYLGTSAGSELETSPSLALLYGTAQARLGHHDEGRRWLDVALRQARKRAEPAVERRALNARGAVALVSGRINEAADCFTQALTVASRDGDDVAVGRCSNNLGIISHLRGRHAEAIGSWELALAAFERAGWQPGVAECHHNLAISYREQGALERALTEADRAVAAAAAAGDQTVWAMAVRGRAEVWLARGELEQARRALDEVREVRHRLADAVGEAEDLRILAAVRLAEGDGAAAERALREAIARAEAHRRPQLLAEATRDLSVLLRQRGRTAQAETAARTAKAIFSRLGAEAAIRQLARQDWDAPFAAELRASVAPLHEAQALADAGHYAELLAYLSGRPEDELERSPMLTLLYGIAHGRLGRLDLGQHWAMVAQLRARLLRDRPLEVRALNVCGAIALERGGLNEATYFFTRAQEEASEANDLATVGRCANNLGIIATIQGDYARALTAYARAITTYEKARCDRGVVEAQHNLAITYREQGRLDDAMQSAAAALTGAERLGDRRLQAQALAGRAEIHVVRSEPDLALRDVERALAVHRELQDVVLETEDLRILAGALGIAGQEDAARAMLREVIDRATEHGRPLLAALAQRDLALLLVCAREVTAAKEVARPARATFERLGARVEVDKLDALLAMPASRTGLPAVAPSGIAPPPRDPSVPEQREGR